MFLENTINHAKQSGWMEVICGSMFSGKTEELIRRLRRAEMAGQKVEIFKPKIDTRYDDVEVANQLANNGVRVVIAGLDMDFLGRPFGPMPFLMATAEYVTKVHAICKKTGNLANYSMRISKNQDLVQLGETDSYEAVSRRVFVDDVLNKKE